MPDYNNNTSYTDENFNAPSGFTGNADSSTGEYRYKSGYSRPVYSDAKYYPASEGATPPRYYSPSRRQEASADAQKTESSPVPPAEKKKKKSGAGRIIGISLLCLLFSCVGGVTGACITELRLSGKLDALGTSVEEFVGEATQGAKRDASVFGANPAAEPEIKSKNPTEVYDTVTDSAQEVVSTSVAASTFEASPSAESAQTLSASDIYDAACSQVVGITTEVTYSNFFGQTSSSAVSGSGFIISEDGKVITNYHVIEYAHQYGYTVSVMLHDGSTYDAEILGVDEDNDIAVLSIKAGDLVPATLGDSDSIRVGETAYAVGNPLGELEFTMTTGTVSGLDRLIASDSTGASINMFQIDATVNSGNSGGPVYNSKGQVIGIVTAKYSSSDVEGIGFAIPINDAKRIAGDIVSNGYVTGKAYLGVCYDESSMSVYNHYYHDLWGSPSGVLVLQVKKGSCAALAGIESYDTITSVGEYTVESGTDLINALRKYSAGDTVVVTVYRAGEAYSTGETIEFTIILDEALPSSGSSSMSEA